MCGREQPLCRQGSSGLAGPGSDLDALGRKGGGWGEGALGVAVEQLAAQAAGRIPHLLPQLRRSHCGCTAGAVQHTCTRRRGPTATAAQSPTGIDQHTATAGLPTPCAHHMHVVSSRSALMHDLARQRTVMVKAAHPRQGRRPPTAPATALRSASAAARPAGGLGRTARAAAAAPLAPPAPRRQLSADRHCREGVHMVRFMMVRNVGLH